MKARLRGYTLVETLIVLAISGVMFVSVATIFGGTRTSTEFSQSMADFQSKIQNYANQISTGAFFDSLNYTCSLHVTGYATLTPSGSGVANSNQDCIYLGKVFQPITGTDHFYVYDVLGRREAVGGDKPVANLSEAMPMPAGTITAPDGSTFDYAADYSQSYDLLNGVKILSVTASGSNAGILKAYTNISSGGGGLSGINAYANNFPSASGSEKSIGLLRCIQEKPGSGCNGSPIDVRASGWDICVQRGDGNQTAVLNIKPSSNSLIATVTVKDCT